MSAHDHAAHSGARTEGACCIPDGEGRCTTCSDEALKVHVVSVDVGEGTALVAATPNHIEEVDISLLEQVGPGDLLLVHAGVALERCPSADDREEEDDHA